LVTRPAPLSTQQIRRNSYAAEELDMAKVPKFELITIPELRGSSGEIRVTLFGVPLLRSLATGVIKPLEKLRREDGSYFDGDFVLFVLVRTMFRCGTHTMKVKDYLPRLFHPCFDCPKELSEEPTKPHQFEFDISQPKAPTFRVRIDAPAVRCPNCGRDAILWTEQVPEDIEAALNEALSQSKNAVDQLNT
jgi:hypothetical protein